MKLLYLMFISICCISMYSCKPNFSKVNQITSQKMTCTSLKQRAKQLRQDYEKYFISGKYTDEALLALSNIPEEYFKNIFTTNGATINITGINGYLPNSNVCGLTFIKKTYNNTTRSVGNIKSTIECLPHEFGHDTFSYLAQTNDLFVSELTTLSNLLYENKEYKKKSSYYLNNYTPKSYWRIDEVLAELFDTWYCSQAARTLLEKTIPEAYTFASTYFLPPVDVDDITTEENTDQTDESDTQTESLRNDQVPNSDTDVIQRPQWFELK